MAQSPTNPKIEELRSRIKADPKSRIFFPLAEELRKNGQLDESEQVLRTGLSNHPTYLSAWVSLGRCLRDQHKDHEAIDALSTALQVDPGNVVAARLLGDAHFAVGDKLEAIKKYKLVRALVPPDEELDELIERLDGELNPTDAVRVAPVDEQPDEAEGTHDAESAAADVEASAAPQAAPEQASPFAEPAATEDPFAEERSDDHAFAPAAQESAVSPFATPEPDDAADSADPVAPPFAEDPFSSPDEPAEPEVVAATPTAWDTTVRAEPDEVSSAAELPFNRTLDTPFETYTEEQQTALETGDAEPMLAEHDDSPFEDEGSDAGYSDDAFAVEHPPGIHVAAAPLGADLGSPWEEESSDDDAARLIAQSEQSAPASVQPADEPADVFAPAEQPFVSTTTSETPAGPSAAEPFASEPETDPFGDDTDSESTAVSSAYDDEIPEDVETPFPAQSEEFTNTVTMADLYARQGLVDEARHVYEQILHRDPNDAGVREKLDALNARSGVAVPSAAPLGLTVSAETGAPQQARVDKLEKWLAKVGRRGVGDV